MSISLEEIKNSPWYKTYPQIVKDQMETYALPEISVYRMLESSAKYYPNITALVYEPENFIVSYKELCALSERFASGLQNKYGVKKGDRIAIYARNYPEFAIAFYGIAMAGAVYVACNPLLIKDEVEYQLKDSGAKILLISDDVMPMAQEIFEERQTDLERIIVFERDEELKPSILKKSPRSYAAPFVKYSDIFSDEKFTKPDISPKTDLVGIIYTSGTTGYPKGVMISHYNVVSSTITYQLTYTGKFPELDKDGFLKCINHPNDLAGNWEFPIRYGIDSVLVIPPWTHMLAFLGQLNFPVMAAMTMYPMVAFNIDSMLDMVRRWKIGFAGGAPQMMAALLGRPDIEQQDISPIRAWTTGGSPTPVALAEKFQSKISGFITEGYALTESTCGSSKVFCNRNAVRKWGSCGIPLAYSSIKVVDPINGKDEMPLGEEGELIQNGPTITMGYWNKPDDTKDSFQNGWLFTGDLGTMDNEGFIAITGRKKELIKYKGYNIAPRMLEEIMFKHPAILGCAAIGKKDDELGEIPIAFVSLKEGAKADAKEIMDFVNGQVAHYKKIREVRFLDAIPTNATGKTNRRLLTAMLEEERAAAKK